MRREFVRRAWNAIRVSRYLGVVGLALGLILTGSSLVSTNLISTSLASEVKAAKISDPLRSVVTVTSAVPANARTARVLGTQRTGNGILIGDDGLVLTIGYLILEATEIKVVGSDGKPVPAEFVGYDHASGLGLLRALEPLGLKAAKLGNSGGLSESDYVIAASSGGAENATLALVMGRRPFAGAWEYVLDNAIFTSPPLRGFQGAALFGQDGKLLGVGSLIIRDVGGKSGGPPGNLFVPINLLKPILADMLAFGRSTEPARPWIGLYPVETNGVLMVNRVAADGPAEAAGIRKGDIMLGVGDKPVREMDRFFRLVWALGHVGVDIPIKILRDGEVVDIVVKSRDRMKWYRMAPSF